MTPPQDHSQQIKEIEKERKPEIGKASPLFLRAPAVCVFVPAIPQRSLLSVALSALPEQVVNMSFPISGAKVLLLFDMCKYFGKKNAKICCKT